MSRQGSWRLCVAFGVLMAGVVSARQAPQTQKPPPPPPVVDPTRITVRPGVIHTVPATGPRRPKLLTEMAVVGPPADNPHTDAKAALGKRLFFDKILSNDRSVSCGTCHEPERAFADARPLAVGVFNRVGKRHSPALINRAFGRSHFWDGRAGSLEHQAVQPISDPNEMDLAVDEAVKRLAADRKYRDEFQTVFQRPVSADDLGRALATYLRTIRSTDSPYDKFAAGDTTALTALQQQGLQIFRTKAICVVCHTEPLFTDEQFQNTGVAWQPEKTSYLDDGRFKVSGLERDRGKFKTPTLREIARTAPYMHDGSLATLEDVVNFYNNGGRPNSNLFPLVRPLRLSDTEKQALVSFLESLSGTVTGK